MSVTSTSNTAVNNYAEMNIDNMDPTTALQYVLGQRAELLEGTLKDSIRDTQEANNKIAALNKQSAQKTSENNQLESDNIELTQQIEILKAQQAGDTTSLDDLKALRSDLGATVGEYTSDDEWMGLSHGLGDDANKSQELYASVKNAGLTIPTGDSAPRDTDGNGTMDATGAVMKQWVGELDAKIAAKSTLAGLEAKLSSNQSTIISNKSVIADCKNDADALSATQQLQMLYVQGLNNKREQTYGSLTVLISSDAKSKENIVSHS